MTRTSESLDKLLQEPIESVRRREQNALNDLLKTRDNRVLLFGAGNLGKQAARALNEIGVTPLAFSDNNPERCGSRIEELEVLAPLDAASRFGKDSVFLVTIWNEFHWFNETSRQLSSYGVRQHCTVSGPTDSGTLRLPHAE
jgi:FlaA1/EpsC-like NDP-sugar epimerase